MRHIDYQGDTREAFKLDVRGRRLHEVLVRVGLLPDVPFVALSAQVDRALDRAVDLLFDEENGMACMTAEDKVSYFETRAGEARMQLEREDREEREAAQRSATAVAISKAEVAFAEATAL